MKSSFLAIINEKGENMKIILASGSPRRKEILSQAGVNFEICASDKEEIITSKNPSEVVCELSEQKAEDVASRYSNSETIVIGADTVVSVDDEILGKPKNREDAFRMIKLLSGRKHQVYTGVTLTYGGKSHTFFAITDVCVRELSDEEINAYVDTNEPYDKAGSYAIQGIFAKYVSGIEGEYHNVMGFPIAKIYDECKKEGIPLFN